MTTRVYCTLRFEGLHFWQNAPEEVGFLRQTHRHIFHVRVEVNVTHDDRDIEFIMMKRHLEQFIPEAQAKLLDGCSCEMLGEFFLDKGKEKWPAVKYGVADVSEDGENGAVVVKSFDNQDEANKAADDKASEERWNRGIGLNILNNLSEL